MTFLSLSDGSLLCSAVGRTCWIYLSAPLLPLLLPHFLCQIVFLLLVVQHLFLFLLLLPTQARTVGTFWNSSLNLTFGRVPPVLLMFGGWRFPPCLNPLLCPVSGPLYSVQLDKALNSAVPSAPQFCPLFPVCIYLFSLHGLHNFQGTQKTTEAQSRIARGSESAKKDPKPWAVNSIETLFGASISLGFLVQLVSFSLLFLTHFCFFSVTSACKCQL